MFADRNATAMIPAKDLDRAVSWYRDKLGLEPTSMEEWGASYALKGVNAFLYFSDHAGTAQNTMLSFDTSDLIADMKVLRERGVTFLDYDLPDLRTENGIAEWGPVKNAWCKDSEGNILGFVQGMS